MSSPATPPTPAPDTTLPLAAFLPSPTVLRAELEDLVVKELLGHVSDSSMNVYIHVPDGAKRAAVDRADARRREVTR